jgi:hypothetical protein
MECGTCYEPGVVDHRGWGHRTGPASAEGSHECVQGSRARGRDSGWTAGVRMSDHKTGCTGRGLVPAYHTYPAGRTADLGSKAFLGLPFVVAGVPVQVRVRGCGVRGTENLGDPAAGTPEIETEIVETLPRTVYIAQRLARTMEITAL